MICRSGNRLYLLKALAKWRSDGDEDQKRLAKVSDSESAGENQSEKIESRMRDASGSTIFMRNAEFD